MQTYFEEVSFDLPTVLAHLCLHRGVQQVLGGDASVCHPLVIAKHPDEDIRDGVLWLWIDRLVVNGTLPGFSYPERVLLQNKFCAVKHLCNQAREVQLPWPWITWESTLHLCFEDTWVGPVIWFLWWPTLLHLKNKHFKNKFTFYRKQICKGTLQIYIYIIYIYILYIYLYISYIYLIIYIKPNIYNCQVF